MGKRRARREAAPPTDLPPAFLARLAAIAGEDADAVLDALERPRAVGVRRNPLVPGPDPWAALAEAGIPTQPLPWMPGAAVVPADRRAEMSRHGAVTDGRLYIQNPASMLPPLALGARPGERVLDLCAAPGSKTLQLWADMGAQGWLSAVEAVRSRFHRLRANLARHGGEGVHTYLKDGASVWRAVPESFDRVLVDAPCSSEGQFQRREPATFAYWSERKVKEMARKQRRLLYSAFQCLKPGGVLVYSTCTLAPEENEAVVAWLLARFPGAVRITPVDLGVPQARAGLPAWRGEAFPEDLAHAVRILPDAVMEGFFLCRLEKTAGTV